MDTDYESLNISIPTPRLKRPQQTYGKRGKRGTSAPPTRQLSAQKTVDESERNVGGEKQGEKSYERSEEEDGDVESDASLKSPSPKRARPSQLSRTVKQRQTSEPTLATNISSTSSLKRRTSSISTSTSLKKTKKESGERARELNRRRSKSVGVPEKLGTESEQEREREGDGYSENETKSKKKRKVDKFEGKEDYGGTANVMQVDNPEKDSATSRTSTLTSSHPLALPLFSQDPPLPDSLPLPTPSTPLRILGDKSNITRSPIRHPSLPRHVPLHPPPTATSSNPARLNQQIRRRTIVQSPRIPIFRDPPIRRTQSQQPRVQRHNEDDVPNNSFELRELSLALTQTDEMEVEVETEQNQVSSSEGNVINPFSEIFESTRIMRGTGTGGGGYEAEITSPHPEEERAGEPIPVVVRDSSMVLIGDTTKADEIEIEKIEQGGGGVEEEDEMEPEDNTIVLATVVLGSNLQQHPSSSQHDNTSPSPQATRLTLQKFPPLPPPTVTSPPQQPDKDLSSPPASQLSYNLTESLTQNLPINSEFIFFTTLPPRHPIPTHDAPSKRGPPAREDDLAYYIRTTSTEEERADEDFLSVLAMRGDGAFDDSDEEAFRASEKEIGVGMRGKVSEEVKERLRRRRQRLMNQILKPEDALITEDGETEDEILLRAEGRR